MTSLTIEELEDFRGDTGDVGTPPAFSDSELQRFYTRSSGDYNVAVLMAYDQLIASAWKFSAYTQNQTTENKQQIFDNLLKTRKLWKDKVDTDIANALKPSQVVIVGTRRVPPRKFDRPANEATGEDFDAGSDVNPR